MIEEEGEMDLDDEMAESGEDFSDDSEEPVKRKVESEPETTAREQDDDDVVDDDALATNIELKRDEAIKQLLAKEDLGII